MTGRGKTVSLRLPDRLVARFDLVGAARGFATRTEHVESLMLREVNAPEVTSAPDDEENHA